MARKKFRRIFRIYFPTTLVLGVVLYFFPSLIFYPVGALLLRDDHPGLHGDHLVVLMGEPQVRPTAAAKAVLVGYADKVLMVTSQLDPLEESGLVPSEATLAIAMMKRTGISEEKIEVIENYGRATSTIDEAIAYRKYFNTKGLKPKRLIVVTSWPHTSRSGWIFEKAFAGTETKIEMMPVEQIPFDKSNWWQSERGLLFVFEEYIKWARYLIKFLGRNII